MRMRRKEVVVVVRCELFWYVGGEVAVKPQEQQAIKYYICTQGDGSKENDQLHSHTL